MRLHTKINLFSNFVIAFCHRNNSNVFVRRNPCHIKLRIVLYEVSNNDNDDDDDDNNHFKL
jgi:hypothetical protein